MEQPWIATFITTRCLTESTAQRKEKPTLPLLGFPELLRRQALKGLKDDTAFKVPTSEWLSCSIESCPCPELWRHQELGGELKQHDGASSAELLCQRGLCVTPGMGSSPLGHSWAEQRYHSTPLTCFCFPAVASLVHKRMPRRTPFPCSPRTFLAVLIWMAQKPWEPSHYISTAFNAFSVKGTTVLKPYSHLSKLVTILEASCVFTHIYQETIERPTELIKKPI